MTVDVSDGPAIVAGYEYRLQVEANSPAFPDGCTLAAQLRAKVSDTTVIATLTTGNGGLVRRSDMVMEIVIAPEASAGLLAGSVVLDVVRTDLQPHQHLNFTLEIPVIRPVTRGLP
ncbi:hypothetical protein [Aquibium sp. ELW1220]|uniref:hypothetical protein n=1 Tax=Aquibium sp. ELW1220 TaxID=2976766 RepID=UPI0025AEE38B|nr:hypothetical protein [Aquibium sp. ELW1220]MDN2578958.1 hypothetical protein [Aquibium sp. ELW1220]